MAFNSPYIPQAPYTPQPYVNINAPSPNYYASNAQQNGIFTRFVNSENEAAMMPNPTVGCSFYVDGDNLVLYAKYADGRPMEIYDLKQRTAPSSQPVQNQPQYLTAEEMNKILDEKLEEMSKKFVIRKERNNNG